MEKRAFINRIRSLYNIDGIELPELTLAQQSDFLRDPVGFFLRTGEAQSDAIMREVERRQSRDVSEVNVRASKSKKTKPKIDGQREMLLPIPGMKTVGEPEKSDAKTTSRRKAG